MIKKKNPAKKNPAKKAVAKKVTELGKMIAKIEQAKKNGEKSVVVFTTSKNNHKANRGGAGFGASDLKPSLLSAYQHLLINYNVETKLVNASEMAVDWVVKIKK